MVRQKASPLQFVAYRSMSGRNFSWNFTCS